MTTTNLVYDRKQVAKKLGDAPIEVRVISDRKSYYFNTGVRVAPTQWSYDRVINHPASDELNERVAIIYKRITAEVNAFIGSSRKISATAIRDAIRAKDYEETSTVVEWMRDQIPLLDVKHGTLKRYNVMLHRLEEYGKFRQWSDITIEGIYEWNAWLRERRIRPTAAEQAQKQKPQRISTSAVYNYHKCFRHMLFRAERLGKIDVNPYLKMRGEIKRGVNENTEYLTDEEMAAIEHKQLPKDSPMELARDLFVFQMYTGLAFSDAQAFDIRGYKHVDGKWRKIGERIKTGVPFVNQLLPPAVAVLEKYGMKIPKVSNADYNRQLKALGVAVGISIPLHSHLARHTFATFMLRHGAKLENVSKMLGHTNITQTLRYAKVLAQSVHDDFDMIEDFINHKNKQQ
jgi:integrase